MSDEPAKGTRVVSAVRSGKLRERWSDPQYAEKERARLRALSAEQRDALAFWRAHPELHNASDPPTPPPAPTPARRPRPRRRPSSAVPRQAASSTPPTTATTPPAPAPNATRRSFFLGRRA